MTDDFKILLEFLDQWSPEVSGREFQQPRGEQAEKLDQFARGILPAEQRLEVCEMLQLHPSWIRWIADRVRTTRLPSSEDC